MQVWFQNRRAKWRKNENTKKGPGRPAHNALPQTCSGEPIPADELRRREDQRLAKKRRRELERLERAAARKLTSKDITRPVGHTQRDAKDVDVVGDCQRLLPPSDLIASDLGVTNLTDCSTEGQGLKDAKDIDVVGDVGHPPPSRPSDDLVASDFGARKTVDCSSDLDMSEADARVSTDENVSSQDRRLDVEDGTRDTTGSSGNRKLSPPLELITGTDAASTTRPKTSSCSFSIESLLLDRRRTEPAPPPPGERRTNDSRPSRSRTACKPPRSGLVLQFQPVGFQVERLGHLHQPASILNTQLT